MRLAPVLIVVAATLAAGCGRQDDRGRVIVLGLDGMEPSVVERMIDEGDAAELPRGCGDGGASGLLRSSKPLLSPIIWTTIATGKPPDAHGIGHFVATNPADRQAAPGDEPRCAR